MMSILIPESQNENERIRSVQALNEEARDLCLRETGRALDLSLRAREQAERTADRPGLAGSLLNIGICGYVAGEYREAREVLNEALTLFEAGADEAGQANALNWLGNVHCRLNNYQDSLALQERSLNLRTRLGDPRGEAASLNNIGLNHYDLGDYDVALDYHLRSRRLYEALYDRHGISLAVNNLANVYDILGEEKRALEYHHLSLRLKREVGNRAGEMGSLNNIGNAFRRRKDYPRALEYHTFGFEIAHELNSRSGQALSLLNLGRDYTDMDQSERALETYLGAFQKFDSIGDRYYGVIARIGIARCQDQSGQPGEALDHLRSALRSAEQLDSKELLFQAHEALATHLEQRSDPASALLHLRASFRYHEAMHGAAARIKIKRLMIDAENEKTVEEADIYRLLHAELTQAYQDLQRADALKAELLEELRLKSEELEHLTLTDSLTGLSNRRHLNARLHQEFERSRRLGDDLTVVMIDIDDFKRVNDCFSHLLGDKTLQTVARILQSCVRSIDVVGRYGGEEFLVLLVETSPTAAADVCKRLCAAVRSYDWTILHPELCPVTISVGYCGDRTIEHPEAAVEAADRRLYAAKRAGKDGALGHD
jgi:diguanylate cyclase (GGDEF)-like protein